MTMSVVWTIIIMMVQLNLANSQSANCSIGSDCMIPLTSNFTKDCNAGRLRNYAECLYNNDCLNPEAANVQLNDQYCAEGGCKISCEDGDPLTCTFMCRKSTGPGNENTDKRQIVFQICTNCFKFRFLFGGASSTTATIGVLIGTTAVAILSTFM